MQDLDIESLRKKRSETIIGHKILYFDSIGSTMDQARIEAENGAREGTAIIADEQTSGRGRFQRAWVSPKGANVYLSTILRPETQHLAQMTMLASLSVSKAIQIVTNMSPTIKWPNDVRINGKKTCGILVESSEAEHGRFYSIIGIGLNVNFDPSQYPKIASIATSLSKEVGHSIPRSTILSILMEQMEASYLAIREGQSLVNEWSSLLDTLGRYVRVSWGGQARSGLAQDVDEWGNLVLRTTDGSILKVSGGEVSLQI